MQKLKSIKIDKKDIIVKELSVKDIMELFDTEENKDKNKDISITDQLNKILPKIVNVSIEDLKEMYPSDIKQIWDAVKEVNSSFFAVMTSLGVEKGVMEIMKTIGLNLQTNFQQNFKSKSVI